MLQHSPRERERERRSIAGSERAAAFSVSLSFSPSFPPYRSLRRSPSRSLSLCHSRTVTLSASRPNRTTHDHRPLSSSAFTPPRYSDVQTRRARIRTLYRMSGRSESVKRVLSLARSLSFSLSRVSAFTRPDRGIPGVSSRTVVFKSTLCSRRGSLAIAPFVARDETLSPPSAIQSFDAGTFRDTAGNAQLLRGSPDRRYRRRYVCTRVVTERSRSPILRLLPYAPVYG